MGGSPGRSPTSLRPRRNKSWNSPSPDPMRSNALLGFLSDYGMVFVLLALCAFFSVATWQDQSPTGEAAARQVAEEIRQQFGKGARVMIAARPQPEDMVFADTLVKEIELFGGNATAVEGEPTD